VGWVGLWVQSYYFAMGLVGLKKLASCLINAQPHEQLFGRGFISPQESFLAVSRGRYEPRGGTPAQGKKGGRKTGRVRLRRRCRFRFSLLNFFIYLNFVSSDNDIKQNNRNNGIADDTGNRRELVHLHGTYT